MTAGQDISIFLTNGKNVFLNVSIQCRNFQAIKCYEILLLLVILLHLFRTLIYLLYKNEQFLLVLRVVVYQCSIKPPSALVFAIDGQILPYLVPLSAFVIFYITNLLIVVH